MFCSGLFDLFIARNKMLLALQYSKLSLEHACLAKSTKWPQLRRAFSRTCARRTDGSSASEAPKGIPYSKLSVGVPKELFQNENRVALSPVATAVLVKKGFTVNVEEQAGVAAKFKNDDYAQSGARITDCKTAFQSDILDKGHLRDGGTLISFLYPAQNKALVDELAQKRMTVFAMDAIPRISRAQVFDALSSMANIAGYKAVIEAANHFGRFFTGQITAAGKVPPAKVLVIGGGVAGLAAVGCCKNMGAIVRAFDTREAVREQVESFGAEFLTISMEQCKEVDIVITTALIPGKKAPVLITKPGSVIVDLAAESGGNVETTKPGHLHVHKGVVHIGYTDLPSRMPTQSSTLYANNISKFLLSIGQRDHFYIDLNDEVVRGFHSASGGKAAVSAQPPPPPPPKPVVTGAKPAALDTKEAKVPDYFKATLKNSLVYTAGLGTIVGLGVVSPNPAFTTMTTIFGLSGIVGYHTVWGVTPALHSPLMSVTNAVSGITAVGGLLLMGRGRDAGHSSAGPGRQRGFHLDHQHLRRLPGHPAHAGTCSGGPNDPKEHNYLYAIPGTRVSHRGAGLPGCIRLRPFLSKGCSDLEQMMYLGSSLPVFAEDQPLGNALGNGSGCPAESRPPLGAMELTPELATQVAACMGAGAGIGLLVAKKIEITDLPQLVAAFHSLVGLAAVLTCLATYMVDYPTFATDEAANVIKTALFLGTYIGGVTFSDRGTANSGSAELGSSPSAGTPTHSTVPSWRPTLGLWRTTFMDDSMTVGLGCLGTHGGPLHAHGFTLTSAIAVRVGCGPLLRDRPCMGITAE
ncbi:hypothetical protein HPB48_011116 [Haemaphysalis longicornis]|uniref:proton-translocating NAD(P)(+) transhydrogenase n=1 Tax=Haemaphysalis longicornis TaxID=44386 RepID=A0A9J6H2Y3_HAELO|nr:hypothetical protein HPB48_011116 [Haemaphysalis longicornis]